VWLRADLRLGASQLGKIRRLTDVRLYLLEPGARIGTVRDAPEVAQTFGPIAPVIENVFDRGRIKNLFIRIRNPARSTARPGGRVVAAQKLNPGKWMRAGSEFLFCCYSDSELRDSRGRKL
jgi:hypothetical protein